MENNEYKGFSLFNDIEDIVLRTRNRAVVLCNISEGHIDRMTKRISPKGASIILNYFSRIPMEERNEVKEKYKEGMQQRGFVLQAN